MQDGAKGETVLERRGHIDDLDPGVTFALAPTPQLQVLYLLHVFAARLGAGFGEVAVCG